MIEIDQSNKISTFTYSFNISMNRRKIVNWYSNTCPFNHSSKTSNFIAVLLTGVRVRGWQRSHVAKEALIEQL